MKASTVFALAVSLLIGLAIGAGMYVSGRLLDRFARRAKSAYGYLPAVALALAIPFFVGFVWAPTWPIALAFLAVPTFLNYFYLSPAVTLVQEEVRPHERVLAGALLLLVMNLVGLGLCPTYLGAASDYFTGRAAAAAGVAATTGQALEPFRAVGLQSALALLPLLGVALAIVVWAASRTVVKDMDRLQSWMRAESA